MGELIAALARMVVAEPAAVQVATAREGGATILELRVAPADVGRIIGRQGRTVRALRQVLAAAARDQESEYQLEIIEED
ncbi:MAG: KH domain-containing protein [Terriglobales bacterium]